MYNCFLMPSRLKSHIILVLDRLQCMARVNCQVAFNGLGELKLVRQIPNCDRVAHVLASFIMP